MYIIIFIIVIYIFIYFFSYIFMSVAAGYVFTNELISAVIFVLLANKPLLQRAGGKGEGLLGEATLKG